MCNSQNGDLSQNATEQNGYVNFNHHWNTESKVGLLPQVNIGTQEVKYNLGQSIQKWTK